MGLSTELSSEAGSFSCCCLNPHGCFQSAALRLYFPQLQPWIEQSVSLPSCSSQFICTRMWDCPLHQPPAHRVHQLLPRRPATAWPAPLLNLPPCWFASRHLATSPLRPGCPSPPLLLVWMNVSSSSPWLSDFHTVRFSVSSGCFLFLNCCCPFGSARRHSVSTYASILAGSLVLSS